MPHVALGPPFEEAYPSLCPHCVELSQHLRKPEVADLDSVAAPALKFGGGAKGGGQEKI